MRKLTCNGFTLYPEKTKPEDRGHPAVYLANEVHEKIDLAISMLKEQLPGRERKDMEKIIRDVFND